MNGLEAVQLVNVFDVATAHGICREFIAVDDFPFVGECRGPVRIAGTGRSEVDVVDVDSLIVVSVIQVYLSVFDDQAGFSHAEEGLFDRQVSAYDRRGIASPTCSVPFFPVFPVRGRAAGNEQLVVGGFHDGRRARVDHIIVISALTTAGSFA